MPLDFFNPEIQNLISALNQRKAFVIAGAGVSSASIDANSRKRIGTWTNLLRYGIQFCCDKCRTKDNWGDSCRTFLDNEHATTEELLKIGDEIWDCLEAHGKVQEWLNIFDEALLDYRELIIAIKALGVPIATANYDKLLEDITHLTPITPQETQKAIDFLRNDQKQKYILHLHGYYKKPESIVLGQKSYDKIVNDKFAQFINQYLVTAYDAVIFVGFGQGVYDQNFSLIFQWVSEYLNKTKLYHLVLKEYVDKTKETHRKNGNPNVVVLGYGENYDDLTPYINALAHNIDHINDLPKTLEGKPTLCIGQNRLELVETVAQYLTKNYTKPAGILGTGGLGKTNLVLNVLHHQTTARKYRRNCFFVRCDGAKDLALLQNTLVNALEMPVSSGDLGDRILNYLSHQDDRSLIALDNFETTWEDKAHVEPFIEKLKDLADLVFTYRGNASPDELDWKTFRVPPLTEADAIILFAQNSEEKFMGNVLVKTIVNEVSYLPLAIELLAKRAKKVERLEDLYRQWQKDKNEFISKGGNKNDNLNLSISFSYENSRLSDANRAFLQALSYLPEGMNRTDLETIFDDAYDQIEILKELGLCEETEQARLWVLAPIREYVKQKTLSDNLLIEKVQDFYLLLIEKNANEISKNNESVTLIDNEWNNIYNILNYGSYNEKHIRAVISLTLFSKFTGNYSLIDLINKSITEAHKLKRIDLVGLCLDSLSELYSRLSKFKEAEENIDKALQIFILLDWQIEIANGYKTKADLFMRLHKMNEAKLYYELALSIFKSLNLSLSKANCFWCLSELFLFEQNYQLSKNYLEKASIEYTKTNDLLGLANCLSLSGLLEEYIGTKEKSIFYHKEALNNFIKLKNNIGIVRTYYYLGNLELNNNQLEDAKEYFSKSIQANISIEYYQITFMCYFKLGEIEYELLNLQSANVYFNNCFPFMGSIPPTKENQDVICTLYYKLSCSSLLQNQLYEAKENVQKLISFSEKHNFAEPLGLAYIMLSCIDESKQKEYECMAKKVWLGAKLDYLVAQMGLTDLECE